MATKRVFLMGALLICGLLFLTGMRELQAAPNRPFDAAAGKAQFAPDQILVKFKGVTPDHGQGPAAAASVMGSLPSQAHQALQQIGGQVKGVLPFIGVLCLQIPSSLSVGQAIEALYRSGAVEYAEPNYQIKLQATPNDPQFNQQWGLNNTGQAGGTPDADVDAVEAWNIQKTATDVVVAVIDTGVDYNHEDLAANMWKNPDEIPANGIDDDGNGYVDDVYGIDGWNGDADPKDTDGHGTAVAGVIAAKSNNSKGIAGVAWSGKIMALRCTGYADSGYASQAITCINYALAMKQREGYRMIINASWTTIYSQSLYDAIKAARDAGVLFVASAHNYYYNQDFYPAYPACFDLATIISVGRSDRYDKPSSAGYGSFSIDLHAPGTDILSTLPGNTYGTQSGPSMAAAHVSGAAAIVWSKAGATYGWKKIKGILLNGVEDGKAAPAFAGKSVTEGRLNLNKSLNAATWNDPAVFSITPNKAWIGDTITIGGTGFGTSGTLKFKGVDFPGGSILSWSDNQIVATVPASLPKGEGRLQATTASGASRGAYFAHGKLEALVAHTLVRRNIATSGQVGADVWIFGGYTDWGATGLVERYNLASNYAIMDSRWMMPTPAYNSGGAAIGTKIYVVGGYDGASYLDTLQIFDTTTHTWGNGKDAPSVLYGPAVVAYGGKLYAFGGGGGGTSTSAYAYDPGTDAWTTLANMPQGTIYAAAAPIGTTGKILVMGGGNWGGEQSVVQQYDVAANAWLTTPDIPNMKKPRSGAAGINYGNKVFCLHGSATQGDLLADSEYYSSGTWKDTVFGSQELYHAVAGRYQDKIFILCGYDNNALSNNVWRFPSP